MSKCNDNWLGKDKLMHLTACIALAIIHPVIGILAGIIKEGYDATKEGNHWCWKDLAWDAVGISLGIIIHYLW